MRRRTVMILLMAGCVACSGDDGSSGTEGSGGDAVGGAGGTATGSSTTSASGGSPAGTGGNGGSGGTATGTPPGEGCYDYSTFTPSTVSFSGDVMPIFANRCASCHDDPTASVYYGSDAAVVYDKALEGTPKQAPHLKFVVPNDPVVSYMLAKVEYEDPGGTCALVQCSEPGCDLFAPPAGMLPEAELAVLRSWVMTGAAND
jgi:hypothetical protein